MNEEISLKPGMQTILPNRTPLVDEGVNMYLEAIAGMADSKGINFHDLADDERKFAQSLVVMEMQSRLPPAVTKEDVDRVIEAINDLHSSIADVEKAVIQN